MRTAFIEQLLDLAAKDKRIYLLTGDLGFTVLEPFAEQYPDRYLNMGVAEQNMTGVAAGLAMSGKIAFTYSIVNFPTLRPLEQIRNDVCYHKANVKIVAIGGGYAYGGLGATHHGTEDLSILRSLPGMTVLAPGDPVETKLATIAAAEHDGPVYLRLGKAREPIVHQSPPDFTIGKAIRVRDGSDVTLITTGGTLPNAVAAADVLAEDGISAGVLSMPSLKPLDAEAVMAAAQSTGAIVTIEENNIIGGLGSACAEVLMEAGLSGVTFKRLGIPDRFAVKVGSQDYLRGVVGLDVDGIVETVRGLVK